MPFKINGREIGAGHRSYIIAEISANHNQSYDEAVRLVHVAKEVGADAVKLQTYTADTITIDCRNEYFQIGSGTIWEGKNLHDLYREAFTPWDWQPRLKVEADSLGIDLFSSPFDPTAIAFLETMNVPAYKIASFELVDLPLIRCAARTGKPLIISTGMASREEIAAAVQAALEAGSGQVALLKCTSGYPASPEEMNLRSIPYFAETFGVPIGLSDHTLGPTVPIAAIALGACIIEKHLTVSRAVPGPDSAFSLEPEEFKAMVATIRETEKALGVAGFGVSEKEAASRIFRRSLFIIRDVKAGETLTEENVRSIRPGNGLPPDEIGKVLGRSFRHDFAKGTPLSWEALA